MTDPKVYKATKSRGAAGLRERRSSDQNRRMLRSLPTAPRACTCDQYQSIFTAFSNMGV